MSKYYCIKNIGEVDYRTFYMMGVTSKSESDKYIGQFGTGSKYGIAALLRAGIDVVVYSGKTKIMFIPKKFEFSGKKFNQIFIKVGNKKMKETSMVVEMGEICWGVSEGLRELVCNAVDEGGFEYFMCDDLFGEEGCTRIYIKVCKDVIDFFNNFDILFAFNRREVDEFKVNNTIIKVYEKIGNDKFSGYRKGVRVVESTSMNSIYDYDISSILVGEDRKVTEWAFLWDLKNYINGFSNEVKERIFNLISTKNGAAFIENYLDVEYIPCDNSWASIVGDKVVLDEYDFMKYNNRLLGRDFVVLPKTWYKFFSSNTNVKTVKDIISASELKGWEVVDVDIYSEALIRKVVEFLNDIGYQISREDIVVANNFDSDSAYGQYIDGKFYINMSSIRKGFDDVLDTLVHEMFHKLSEAGDCTDKFERFIISEAIYFMKRYLFLLKGGNNEDS